MDWEAAHSIRIQMGNSAAALTRELLLINPLPTKREYQYARTAWFGPPASTENVIWYNVEGDYVTVIRFLILCRPGKIDSPARATRC